MTNNVNVNEETKTNKCGCCGLSEWNGKPIDLQLYPLIDEPNKETLMCPICIQQNDPKYQKLLEQHNDFWNDNLNEEDREQFLDELQNIENDKLKEEGYCIEDTTDTDEKLYIYSRVSTEVQSTDNQIDLGVKVSENLGLKPITFDEGHSSSNLDTIDQTPKLKELISMVVNGEVSNLWVHSMDRLSRNNSVSNYIRKTLKENNVRLYVGNSNEYDMGNHNDKLVMEEIMKCFP